MRATACTITSAARPGMHSLKDAFPGARLDYSGQQRHHPLFVLFQALLAGRKLGQVLGKADANFAGRLSDRFQARSKRRRTVGSLADRVLRFSPDCREETLYNQREEFLAALGQNVQGLFGAAQPARQFFSTKMKESFSEKDRFKFLHDTREPWRFCRPSSAGLRGSSGADFSLHTGPCYSAGPEA